MPRSRPPKRLDTHTTVRARELHAAATKEGVITLHVPTVVATLTARLAGSSVSLCQKHTCVREEKNKNTHTRFHKHCGFNAMNLSFFGSGGNPSLLWLWNYVVLEYTSAPMVRVVRVPLCVCLAVCQGIMALEYSSTSHLLECLSARVLAFLCCHQAYLVLQY
jgi:hypothetical protein